MKKFIISVFLYIGEDPDPVLLAEQEYNEYNYHSALQFIDYEFKDEKNIVVAFKEVK